MAKYKKINDYYTKGDYSVKLGKGADFVISAGTKLEFTKQVNDSYLFKVYNTPFVISVKDSVSDDYIGSVTDEIGRSAGL